MEFTTFQTSKQKLNTMNNTTEASLEVMAPSALEAIERASIDVQVATAHKFPRSLAKFRQRATELVQQDLATAESCIYSRPVGKDPETGKQKYVEGASIRMAEIVASCFGNIRFGARIIEQTERYVKCQGVAHDLEGNTLGTSEAMESTVKRNGQLYDERMRIVVAKACLSKALRDAIFRVVPRGLCKSITDAAILVIQKQAKTIEQRRDAAKKWLTSIRVDDARAFAVLGVAGWVEVTEDHLLQLTGLKTAMNDNEVTIDEAFPPIGQPVKPTMPTPPTHPAPVTKPAVVSEASISKPPPQPAAPSEPAKAETPPDASGATAQASPEPVQQAPEPSNEANSAESQPEQTPAPVVTGTPLEICRGKIAALDIPEKQLMRYLQALKPPMARGTQNELGQLADPKLVNIAAQLDSDKVVEAIKATAV